MKVYCVDSYDAASWSNRAIPLEERARRHGRYESWVLGEVLPWIYRDCGGAAAVATLGCSMGAFHAANFALKHADRFPLAMCLSGNYDPASWHGWGERGSEAYFNNPLDYVGQPGTAATSTGCAASSACCWCAARASGRTPPGRCPAPGGSPGCWPARASGTNSTCGASTCPTTGRPGAPSSPITCRDSANGTALNGGPALTDFQAPDRVAARHRGGLAAGVRGDPAPGGPGRGRRRRQARLRLRADHHRAVRPARPAPLQPGHRPARVLVLRPAGMAEEGLPDEQRVPAEQPVHVPVDGEARGLLRDDAAGPQGAGDRARPLQEPGGQRPLRLHRRPLQPAVRPRRHRRADRLPAVHEAVRRRRLARRLPDQQPGRAARRLRPERRDAHAPAEGHRLRRVRPLAVDRRRDDGHALPAGPAHAPALRGRPRLPRRRRPGRRW